MPKTMTRKTETKNISELSSESKVESKEITNESKETKKQKKVFDQSEGVMCHSVTQGGLFVEGPKTSMIYRFIDYGDECEIEYRDLTALVRSKSSYVYHPYFIIDDEDFIAEFPQIVKFYDEQYSIKDLKAILKEDVYTMTEAIKKLPATAVENLKTIAATQISNGYIDSIAKVRTLNEIFGTELEIADNLASL